MSKSPFVSDSPFDNHVVVVFGGRDFKNESALFSRMDKYHAKYHFVKVIGGGAAGVDSFAINWAKARGIDYQEEPSDWTDMSEPCLVKTNFAGKPYNALAGLKRNQSMIDKHKPTYAIEFPGGPGTLDMHNRILKAIQFGIVNKHIIVKRKTR